MTALPPLRSPQRTDVISSEVVCRVTGATYRQLDSWVTMGYATVTESADGAGSRRGFAFDDVVRVAALRRLAELGVPPSMASPLVERLDADAMAMSEGTVHVVDADLLARLLGSGAAIVGISPIAVAVDVSCRLSEMGLDPVVYGADWWDDGLDVVYGSGVD